MLEPRDIIRLRLDSVRLAEHQRLRAPAYAQKPLSRQFNAINEAVISSILNLDFKLFRAQLERARALGTSYVLKGRNNRKIGFAGATSLIRSGQAISKNLIVPINNVFHSAGLDEHIIIGSFIRGKVDNGLLPGIEELEIGGWAKASDVKLWSIAEKPFNFKTDISVIMMPCAKLNPISTLEQYIEKETK